MSITLTNSAVLSVNGLVAETDPNASLYYMELVFPSSVRLFYGYGSTSGSVFSCISFTSFVSFLCHTFCFFSFSFSFSCLLVFY